MIESFPGGAIARQGQHQVIFANDLATAGAIDMQTPDGKRLTSHVLGLSYFDAATGTNVLIAEVTNCLGRILPPNQVIYENAFDTLKASVRYTYTRGGLEQDIILLEAPAPPEAYGLNPATTRLAVMTEFLNPPQPAVQQTRAMDSAGTPLQDDLLDFGAMQVGPGAGFLLGRSAVGAGLPILKQWAKLEGRQFLIEQVRAPDLFEAISSLPGKRGASLKSTREAIRFTASSRQLPWPKPGKADTKAMEIASGRQPAQGFVLDYFTMVGTNNFTFQSGVTYYVSGAVGLGTIASITTFEGGAVIKFTNLPSAKLSAGSCRCTTGPYRMAYFTSKDDDSVGETILGSTHNPTNYNGATYLSLLYLYPLKYCRFSYAGTALVGGMSAHSLWDCQFVQCAQGVTINSFSSSLSLYNVLFVKGGTAAYTSVARAPLVCENVTVDGNLLYNNSQVTLLNSIVACTNSYGINSSSNSCVVGSSAGLFQTVGGGSYYLVDGSTNRNAGTTSIVDPALLAELKAKTTYPPILLTNNLTADTALSPQIQRDTDVPDLGYHYDPLDYVVSGLTVTNTLLLTNGVALATYGTSAAITLSGSGQLVSQGLANNLNCLARYNTVQEQSTTNWSSTNTCDTVMFGSQTASAQCAFTAWSIPGRAGSHVNQTNDVAGSWFAHNQFTGGAFAMNPGLVALTNCLWEGVAVTLDDQADNNSWYLYNNLLHWGSLSYRIRGSSSVAIAYDNLFDRTTITQQSGSTNFTSGYNGYMTNWTTLSGSQGNDVTIVPPINSIYTTSYLGNYYYPNSGLLLFTLVNAGSRWATNAGLYHFTTTVNQAKEAGTQVDIGFHYVAIDPSTGQPYEMDGDGVPDYLEDANGNGAVNSGETDWQSATDMGLKVLITRPRNGATPLP